MDGGGARSSRWTQTRADTTRAQQLSPHVAARPPANERGPLPPAHGPCGQQARRGHPAGKAARSGWVSHGGSALPPASRTGDNSPIPSPHPPAIFFLPGNRALSRSPRLTVSEPGYSPAVENPTASLPFPHYGLIKGACRRTAKNQPLSDP